MNVLVLEDERPALEQLISALHAWDAGARVTHLDSVGDAVRWLLEHGEPDVILADIRLTDGRSLQIFERVPVRCPVVFVTAYDDYSQAALAAGGIDYVFKPVQPARLAAALDKVLRLGAHFRGAAATAAPRRRLLVRRGGVTMALAVDEVRWFHTEHRLVFATCRDGSRHVVDQTLASLADELDSERFLRVNRSCIVGIDAVRAFRPHGKGRLLLELEPQGEAVVSADVARDFRAWLDR